MRARPVDICCLLLGLGVAGLGSLTSGQDLEAWVGRLAADGSVEYFSGTRMEQVRWAIVAGGLLLAVLPWLVRRTREGGAVEASRARPVLAALVVAFVAAGLARTVDDPPVTTDTKYYLGEALDIQARGGVLALPGRCLRGEYTENNRHPAYLAGLSLLAERSGRFPARARLLSLAGAVASLLLLFRVTARRWGEGAGLLAASLLALGAAFRLHAVAVACETWFVAAGLAWYDLLAREPGEHGPGRAAGVGALAALAWLIKGTGLLLLLVGLVHLALTRGRRAPKEVALAAGAFALAGLPLLWRNVVNHGDPLFNVNTSRVLWLDDYQQFRDPALRSAAGPLHYLETHGPGEIALRLASGAPKTGSDLLDALAPARHMALGLAVLVLAALGLRARAPGGAHSRAVLLGLVLPYLLSLAWYARIATGSRFPLAVAPLLLAPAGWALARMLPRGRGAGVVTLAASLALLVGAVGGGLPRWPARFEASPVEAEVAGWLRRHIGLEPHLHYAMGPSHALDLDWDLAVRGDRHPLPADEAQLAALGNLLWGHELRALVLDRDGLERSGCGFARWDEELGLVPDRVPPGWRVVARFPELRPEVLILTR